MSFTVNDWVRHPKFGDGVIREDSGDKYVVCFVSSGERTLLKTAITLAGSPPSPGFQFPKPKGGGRPRFKVERPRRREVFAFDHLISGFLRVFVGGFEGAHFKSLEWQYKIDAADLLRESCAQQPVQSLLEAADYEEICRRALRVVRKTNLVFPQEQIKLADALTTAENRKLFAEQLYSLLHSNSPEETRFNRFVEVLGRINALMWTTATYFQFLHTRGRQMFMKPVVTQRMADSLDFALNYRPEPNWLTYCKLQELARVLDGELKTRGLNPHSGIDLQGFIWASIRIAEGSYAGLAY